MVYKCLNIFQMVFTYWKYLFPLPILFFGIISLIARDKITLIIGIIFQTLIIPFTIFTSYLHGITIDVTVNENIIEINKNKRSITFYKKNYELVNFNIKSFWEGILLKEDRNICKLWDYEFKKKDWMEIENILIENSKNIKSDNDEFGLKYGSIFSKDI